jgi:hypothetical protein
MTWQAYRKTNNTLDCTALAMVLLSPVTSLAFIYYFLFVLLPEEVARRRIARRQAAFYREMIE